MLTRVAKLLISAIVLLVLIAITMGVLQMTNRSRITRVVEDYMQALCDIQFDKALSRCSREGHLIRNGKKIPFADVSAVCVALVGQPRHGKHISVKYHLIDVVGDQAVVHADITAKAASLQTRRVCKFHLKRENDEWKIVSIADSTETGGSEADQT